MHNKHDKAHCDTRSAGIQLEFSNVFLLHTLLVSLRRANILSASYIILLLYICALYASEKVTYATRGHQKGTQHNRTQHKHTHKSHTQWTSTRNQHQNANEKCVSPNRSVGLSFVLTVPKTYAVFVSTYFIVSTF